MKEAMKGLLKSKKFLGLIVSLCVLLANTIASSTLGISIPEDTIQNGMMAVMTWLGAQGLADFGKESTQTSKALTKTPAKAKSVK